MGRDEPPQRSLFYTDINLDKLGRPFTKGPEASVVRKGKEKPSSIIERNER